MKVIHFEPSTLNPQREIRVFPRDIEDDSWVLYHGTYDGNSVSIETGGLKSGHSELMFESMRQIASIFEKLKWVGEHMGGYPVLKAYSLDFDCRGGRLSPIFLAETSHRALLYASRDFAGGEKLRALRIAIGDLHRYTIDLELRETHKQKMLANVAALTRLNASRETIENARPPEFDVDWLRSEILAFDGIRRLAEDALASFRFGVVYALKFSRADVENMKWHNCMGVEFTGSILPSRIVAKAIIPPTLSWHGGEADVRNLTPPAYGVLANLAAAQSPGAGS